MDSMSSRRPHRSLRRTLAGVGIAAYLAVQASVLALNVIGDVQRHPIVYFFTWDMFPGSYDVSTRRMAIAETKSGAYIQIYPNPTQRFRGGVHGDMTRADLDRSGVRFPGLVDAALEWARPGLTHDRLVRVVLVEQYWPSRLNLSAGSAEDPPREFRYWRVIETRDARP